SFQLRRAESPAKVSRSCPGPGQPILARETVSVQCRRCGPTQCSLRHHVSLTAGVKCDGRQEPPHWLGTEQSTMAFDRRLPPGSLRRFEAPQPVRYTMDDLERESGVT